MGRDIAGVLSECSIYARFAHLLAKIVVVRATIMET